MGGHGPVAPQYGLGVDQWLEAKVVTADGELKIANAVTNPDLFWAIRGGGGGTFGVVVEATWKAHADIPITGHYWWINSTTADQSGLGPTDTGINDALKFLMKELVKVYDQGLSGSYHPTQQTIRGFTAHPGNLSGIARANAVWSPILEKLQTFPGMTKYQSKAYEYNGFAEFYAKTYGSMETEMEMGMSEGKGSSMRKRHGPEAKGAGPPYRGLARLDGRLLTADHMKDPELIEVLKPTRRVWSVIMLAPRDKHGDGKDTSAHPGWRKATMFLASIKDMGTFGIDALRKYAPDMGTYGNEVRRLLDFI